MNRKKYVSAEVTIITFSERDIIVTSGGQDPSGEGGGLFFEEGVANDIFGD